MTGFWPIFFLLVVLKIPVLGGIWLVFWASRQDQSEPEEADGGSDKRRNMPPKLPRGPRRGPHGGGGFAMPLPDCPPGGRTRIVKPVPLPASARAGSRAGRDRNRPRPYDA